MRASPCCAPCRKTTTAIWPHSPQRRQGKLNHDACPPSAAATPQPGLGKEPTKKEGVASFSVVLLCAPSCNGHWRTPTGSNLLVAPARLCDVLRRVKFQPAKGNRASLPPRCLPAPTTAGKRGGAALRDGSFLQSGPGRACCRALHGGRRARPVRHGGLAVAPVTSRGGVSSMGMVSTEQHRR